MFKADIVERERERERKGRAKEEQRKNKIEQNECCLMNIKKHTFSP
jgi:hypothetical protein